MFYKNIVMTILFLSTTLVFVSCSAEKKETKTIIVKKSDIVLKKIGVDGMTCMGCEVTLEGAISKIEGVTKVKASAEDGSAEVEFDKTKTDLNTIVKTIQDAGYKAK
ncbi:heavy-metal-associated domain-containing protein [Sulfurimonas sp. SAG-AH-194-C21]|nr:cation transporter [Sulfurimonas sp. SAG-AH-194-C21]MDF1884145.1 heavy-metal-associated domain-containing protein [Sulfurimonas sp. SAG-AH-194-C21]